MTEWKARSLVEYDSEGRILLNHRMYLLARYGITFSCFGIIGFLIWFGIDVDSKKPIYEQEWFVQSYHVTSSETIVNVLQFVNTNDGMTRITVKVYDSRWWPELTYVVKTQDLPFKLGDDVIIRIETTKPICMLKTYKPDGSAEISTYPLTEPNIKYKLINHPWSVCQDSQVLTIGGVKAIPD